MTKSEIIESTLRAMRGNREPTLSELKLHEDNDTGERHDLIVRQILAERLPEVDLRACADLAQLGAACCNICHTSYPCYQMDIEVLPDGGKAWVCCSVLRALRGEKTTESEDEIDLEVALGGGLRTPTEEPTGLKPHGAGYEQSSEATDT